MRIITITMLLALIVSSCASIPHEEVYLQSGKQGHAIRCDNAKMDDCRVKAGELCQGSGYNIFSKREDRGDIIMTITCREG